MKIISLLLILILSKGSYSQTNILQIETDDFVISFPSVQTDDHYILGIENVSSDSILIDLELGDTIERSEIVLEGKDISEVMLFQNYETSVTVMNEGPHLDLTSWKHFESEWKQLTKTASLKFYAIEYQDSERIKFPDVQIEEVKQAVLSYGGEGWYNYVKEIKSYRDYPCDVGISEITLKITYNKNSQSKTKYLVFNVAMGC